ncbi:MAG: ribokinase [Proteobacteria bacterium]|nr:ribokinase [Pseudomonadota bacterium]
MSNPAAVLVAGSANLDFVVRAAHIPAPGETVLGREFSTQPGGKGANQAVASARAGGAPTQMLLALGDDAHAAPLLASLQQAGVALHLQRAEGTATGCAFICVSDDGQNAITVAPGANAALQPDHLPPLAGIGQLLLQLETPLPTVTAYALAARAAGLSVTLNAAPALSLPAELRSALDLLIVNEGELAAITGVAGDLDTALSLLSVPNVVVTLGARGLRARCDGVRLDQPAFEVPVVDTTGAGDTFCGALVAERLHGSGWPNALRFASAAAALACTRPGAQASIPTRDEVLKFLAT